MQRIKKWMIGMFLVLCLTGCRKDTEETFSLSQADIENDSEDTGGNSVYAEEETSIFVYVCGAVNCEGVYELPEGSRVYEAIALAGGFREDAQVAKVNQAEILEDEQQIYVPMVGEELQPVSEDDGKVNINKASKEELMTLPGVGESRAESIIKYREDVGAFQNIEDIMQVSGIKEGLFEKIKDLITV